MPGLPRHRPAARHRGYTRELNLDEKSVLRHFFAGELTIDGAQFRSGGPPRTAPLSRDFRGPRCDHPNGIATRVVDLVMQKDQEEGPDDRR
jgi:hypothetical protein